MIKRFALAAILILSSAPVFAQNNDNTGDGSRSFGVKLKSDGKDKEDKKTSGIEKPSRDFVMLQLTYDAWDKPDSIKTKGFNRGFNAYVCYDFPIKKTNFSFAAGIGVGTTNVFLDNQQIVTNVDTNSAATFITETKNYKKYKMTASYLEAPFELRFYGNRENRNRGFKAAIGLRVGTLLSAHTKGRITSPKITDKENTKRYLETWRFATTLRLGWGNFNLIGTYNLTQLYKENQGPAITPFSFGICITGL